MQTAATTFATVAVVVAVAVGHVECLTTLLTITARENNTSNNSNICNKSQHKHGALHIAFIVQLMRSDSNNLNCTHTDASHSDTHTHSPTHIGLVYALEAASAAAILADKLSPYTHTHTHIPGSSCFLQNKLLSLVAYFLLHVPCQKLNCNNNCKPKKNKTLSKSFSSLPPHNGNCRS